MKRKVTLMLSLLIIVQVSCKKDVSDLDILAETITIDGTLYTTVAIGTKTWTASNYNGVGGVNYKDGVNDPFLGKLYSWPEIKAIANLPKGWRIPTEADVKSLMTLVGTKVDLTQTYTDATSCAKLISTTGWTNVLYTGLNTTKLNLHPTGYLSISALGTKTFSDKGIRASFWTSTTVQSGGKYLPLLFEISTSSVDARNQPAGLRGGIYSTTANGDGVTTMLAEKRSLRFVKDN
ncbi:FISUMP domain-containing protein [Pedobacter duraquae]|uniref:Uncharacterized protein (TIGR02145 family) n=1 Tax=Pedobacter duraquae TaxID=425511 RepID=A0A4R6IDW8_9SPHI|nr:FISUMP domain-containing protein [Pedobacter duraquae]TDO20222.1 uncharacterized protein (TIGR02145 family) [Pedobacter duraquae]